MRPGDRHSSLSGYSLPIHDLTYGNFSGQDDRKLS